MYKKVIQYPFERFTPLFILLTLLSFAIPYALIGILILGLVEIRYRKWTVGPLEFIKFLILQMIGSFVVVICYLYGCKKFGVNPFKPMVQV